MLQQNIYNVRGLRGSYIDLYYQAADSLRLIYLS